jgi:glycosyltransferase involved in cell wall biosynthesis
LIPEPLISCIMPTRNRRRFVSQAVYYFLRQSYPQRELIVVDDGDDPVGDLLPDDERIRYLRLGERTSLAAKRNLGCEVARGELIAHWDDDDWMASDRLIRQLEVLNGAVLCGAHSLLYYDPFEAAAWRLSPRDDGVRLAGGTLVYRRSLWEACPFDETDGVRCTGLVARALPNGVRSLDAPDLYVGLLHRGNTTAHNLRDPAWERRPVEEVGRIIGEDRAFYAALRNRRNPVLAARRPAATPQAQVRTALPQRMAGCALSPLTVAAHYSISTGYGSMAEYMVRGLARAGVQVDVLPLSLQPSGLSPEFCDLLSQSSRTVQEIAVYFSWPRPELARMRPARSLFINTMWESSQLPPGWAVALNRACAVIVPSRFAADVCRKSGVTVPITVIPEGIDPAIYTYQARGERPGITTLIVAPVDERKNTLLAIEAWQRAFADDGSARLIIKTQYNYQNYIPTDPRITYIDRAEPTRGILRYYRQADVLLALGNEGFGLPLVEGMATGLPVIALASEGQADICAEAQDYLLPVLPDRHIPYRTRFGPAGVRGVPAVAEVEDRLRWVAENRDEAREMGRAASRWTRAHRSVWAKAPALLSVIEEHTYPQRSLRRAPTFWVPTWREACGVAEYTAHLCRALPAARATAHRPEPHTARPVHIQHEPSLFSDAALSRQIQRLSEARTPVAVTAHAVAPCAGVWEAYVDGIVALTSGGAETLRARTGGARIVHIPPGCAEWDVHRKGDRGRVIGAFGFLEPHKGFWQLLDVLRALPDTELLLFSYAKSHRIEAEWDAAAAGLPVRRIRTYLPEREIAQRLAAEADILAFWYDEPDWHAASAAVRTGLATGVPVLASPTRWFADLKEVTYQPDDLVDGVQRLLADTALRAELVSAAREYCHEHRWEQIARQHEAFWQLLEST